MPLKREFRHQSQSNWPNSLAPQHLGFEKQVVGFFKEPVQRY